jgi:transposase
VIARRHGISNSLLYNWRSAWKAAASLRARGSVEFLPIGMIGGASDAEPRLLAAQEQASPSERQEDRAGRIEIDLPNGARVRVDTSVNEKALARVLRALKGRRDQPAPSTKVFLACRQGRDHEYKRFERLSAARAAEGFGESAE